MHFVGGRDPGNVLRNVPLRRRDPATRTRSTRSSAPARRWRCRSSRSAGRDGLHCHYIESAARSDGPSKTASMISRIPGVNLYAQYPAWADGKWHYRGAVFDSFVPAERATRSVRRSCARWSSRSGTFKDYGFERLVRRLLEILPAEAEVLWQTGDTDVTRAGH